MIDRIVFLHKYIFAKVCRFYASFLREKKHPHLYASCTMIFIVYTLLLNFYGLYEYIYFPNVLGIEVSKYVVASLLAFGSFCLYTFMNKGKRYKMINDEVGAISATQNTKWKIIAWSYFIIIIATRYVLSVLVGAKYVAGS